MENRIDVASKSKNNQRVAGAKGAFQSQSYLYHDLVHPVAATLYGECDFDQFLVDSVGQYWFTEKAINEKKTTQIFIFNGNGALIKNLVVKGRPTLYELECSVIVACEGIDGESYIYKFCKKHLNLIQEWVIDGFLWDLESIEGALYITSYLSSINEAVLYIIDDTRKRAIDLGTGVFPSGILFQKESLFIAFSFIHSGSLGKIVKYDLYGNANEELMLNVAPRQMFTYKDKIVLHGLDMTKGSADQIVYFDTESGHCTSYKIPKTSDIRPQGKHLLLHNQETESIIYWSHEKRKIIRIVRIATPIIAKQENTHWSL